MPLWRPAFPDLFPEESEVEARITSIFDRFIFQLLAQCSFKPADPTHFSRKWFGMLKSSQMLSDALGQRAYPTPPLVSNSLSPAHPFLSEKALVA